MCVCVCVRPSARLHVQCVYTYIYILVCLVVAIFSHLVFHPLSTASIVYNFSYPSIVFSNSQRSMRVNPFLRTMQKYPSHANVSTVHTYHRFPFYHLTPPPPSLPPPPFFSSLYRSVGSQSDISWSNSWQNFFIFSILLPV